MDHVAASRRHGWWQAIGPCEVCMRIFKLGFLALLAALVAACSTTSTAFQPTTEEMRGALVTLLDQQPDISIPEFKTALELSPPVVRNGVVFIGPWNCDPQLRTFVALFSAPNLTMYEVSGRFEMTPRGHWIARTQRVLPVNNREIGEYWRAQDVDPAFQEPTGK
jgi:hypothetical protein